MSTTVPPADKIAEATPAEREQFRRQQERQQRIDGLVMAYQPLILTALDGDSAWEHTFPEGNSGMVIGVGDASWIAARAVAEQQVEAEARFLAAAVAGQARVNRLNTMPPVGLSGAPAAPRDDSLAMALADVDRLERELHRLDAGLRERGYPLAQDPVSDALGALDAALQGRKEARAELDRLRASRRTALESMAAVAAEHSARATTAEAELADALRWLGTIHSTLDPDGVAGEPGDWSVTARLVRDTAAELAGDRESIAGYQSMLDDIRQATGTGPIEPDGLSTATEDSDEGDAVTLLHQYATAVRPGR